MDLPAGGLARATLEMLRAGGDGTWSRTYSHHLQRHHDASAVQAALTAAGLEAVALHGMHLDGSLSDDLDELGNTKAIYIARHRQSPLLHFMTDA